MMRPLFVLFLFTLACGSSPTQAPVDPLAQSPEDAAIQHRLTGQVAWMDDRTVRVTWALGADGYRLEAHDQNEGLVQWEVGQWWVSRVADALVLVVDRTDGAMRQRDLTWKIVDPIRYPLPLLLLGRSLDDPDLQIRIGATYNYRLVPLDSLEIVKTRQ